MNYLEAAKRPPGSKPSISAPLATAPTRTTEKYSKTSNSPPATFTSVSSLHEAASAGFSDEIRRLITEEGANVSARDSNGDTPLHLAARCSTGGETCCQVLLDRGANLEAENAKGRTPLFEACRVGNFAATAFLLDIGAKVNAKDTNKFTPLHAASTSAKAGLALLLIGAGAKVNARNKEGLTPIHCAAKRDDAEMLSALLEEGGDALAADAQGCSALHLAAINGAAKAVKAMLEQQQQRQINVEELLEMPDSEGRIALHVAAQEDKAEVVRMLLDCGAAIDASDKHGERPLHYTAKTNAKTSTQSLIDGGADKDARDADGATALMTAVRCGAKDVAVMLLSGGADVDAPDDEGRTALHVAVEEGSLEMAAVLVKAGADKNAGGQFPPLRYAIENEMWEMTAFLIESGADVTIEAHCLLPDEDEANNQFEKVLSTIKRDEMDHEGRVARGKGAALRAAVCCGAVEFVEATLSSSPHFPCTAAARIKAQRKGSGETAMHLAARCGIQMVHLLLRHGGGAALSKVDAGGETPLHVAGTEEVLDLMLKCPGLGADAVGMQDNRGRNVVHSAAEKGWASSVEAALAVGGSSSTDAADVRGLTPLHLAAMAGHAEVVAALLAAKGGAAKRVAARDKGGKTALHFAVDSDEKLESVRLLLRHGADVDSGDREGRRPIRFAALNGCFEVAKLLLSQGAKVDEVSLELARMSKGERTSDLCALLGETAARKKIAEEDSGRRWHRCTVCMEDTDKVFLFLPCGHASTCQRCSQELVDRGSACPLCRCHIQNRIKVFLN